MSNKAKFLSVVLVLIVVGFATSIHWFTSKASVANSTFSATLKTHQGAKLNVRRQNSSAEDGKVDFVGEDFIQSSSGMLYPFSAIVTAHRSGITLTIEIR
jgi:hypothetical protein